MKNLENSVETPKRCLSCWENASEVQIKRAETNGSACFRASASSLVKCKIVRISHLKISDIAQFF